MTKSGNDKIRLLATSFNGHRFAVAEFKERIQVWDIHSGLISEINSDLDFGGVRMALIDSVLIVGSFHKGTVTAYSVDTTEKVWVRKDLKKCQIICPLKRRHSILVVLADGHAQILSTVDGSTVGELHGVKGLWESSEGTRALIEGVNTFRYVTKGESLSPTRGKSTFAILDACFTDSGLIVSYSAGPVEMINLPDLTVKWSTWSKVGHFLNVGFSTSIDKVVAVKWNYDKDGPYFLCHMNSETGAVEKEIDIGYTATASFLNSCEFLLTSRGELLSTHSGKLIRPFDF